MNIVQVPIRYAPAMGGAEEYVKHIAEGLFQRGHDINVFTSDLEDHVRLKKIDAAGKETMNGVQIDRSYTMPLRLRHYSFMPSLPCKLMLKKADLIHGHGLMSFPADIAGLISKIKKTPFVFNPYFADLGPPSILGRLYRQTLGKIVFDAQTVVCVSEYEKHMIEINGIKTRQLEVVFPGVDLEAFANSNINIFEKYQVSGNKIILFVGRLEPIKGVDVLLKAVPLILKEIPEAKFFIAGPDFGRKTELEALAGDMNISDKIIFAGRLARKDLISSFLNADLFCFPSKYEAFGIVLAEAMAAKLPIVASDCSAISYLVKNENNGLLFKPGDYRQLARQILLLFKNNKLRQNLVDNGYQEVSRNYNWTKTIDKMEWIYNALMRS